MKCNNCGNILQENDRFCNVCGNEVQISNNDEQKTRKKPVIIIIILVLVLLGILITIVGIKIHDVVNKNISKKEATKTEEKNTTNEYIKKKIDVSKLKVKTSDEISKNIEVIKMIYDDNEYNHRLFILLKNNNDVPVTINTFLNYLDKNNVRVDRKSDYGYVNAGNYYAVVISNMTKEEYSSTNIEIVADKVKSYMHTLNIDSSSIKISNNENDIVASYTNTNDNDINIYFGVIYYKNDKIVFFDNGFASSVKKGTEGITNFYIGRFPKYDYTKEVSNYYDRYEVFISSATYKDSTY